jgi:hypothetical protein
VTVIDWAHVADVLDELIDHIAAHPDERQALDAALMALRHHASLMRDLGPCTEPGCHYVRVPRPWCDRR